ncbi:hypothetical protein DU53_07865, partial [Kosmotoga sp. DU53]
MKNVVEDYSKRYRKARKKEKSEILEEFTRVTKYNRSYASFLLRGASKKRKTTSPSQKKGRKKKYDHKVFVKLVRIWEIMDFPCGKRLEAVMGEVIDNLVRNGHLTLTEETKRKLLNISASTIDRLLSSERK